MALTYPTAQDYVLAVGMPQAFVLDPILKHGRAATNNGAPLIFSGSFARVFLFEVGKRKYALRCWISDAGDVSRNYEHAQHYFASRRFPFIADFDIQEKGILINGECWPTLRMEWIEGPTLKEFLQGALGQPERLRTLRTQFLQICRMLHAAQIAHRDLQAENILICRRENREQLVLIDYDTIFLPGLEGRDCSNAGLPSYQHPSRGSSSEAAHYDDYFSELVIYLSMFAFERQPELWDRFRLTDRDKALLFESTDYARPSESEAFRVLLESDDADLARMGESLLRFCEIDGLKELAPLEKVLEELESVQIRKLKAPPSRPVQPPAQPTRSSGVWEKRARGSSAPQAQVPPPTPIARTKAFRPARPGEDWARVVGEHLENGDIEGAIRILNVRNRRDKDSASWWNLMGICRLETGQDGEAAHAFEKAARLDGSDENIWFNLGSARENLDQHRIAARCFEIAFDLAPSDPEVREKFAKYAQQKQTLAVAVCFVLTGIGIALIVGVILAAEKDPGVFAVLFFPILPLVACGIFYLIRALTIDRKDRIRRQMKLAQVKGAMNP